MSISFVRYIFPTLALSKSGFRVETESRFLSAGFRQLPVSNIKVVQYSYFENDVLGIIMYQNR